MNLWEDLLKVLITKNVKIHSVSFRTFKGMWLSVMDLLKSVCKRIKIINHFLRKNLNALNK